MKRILLSFLFITGISFVLQTQAQIIPCYTHEAFEINSNRYPGYREAVERSIQNALKHGSKMLSKTSGGDTVFRIPVVFHVVWNTNAENLHDSIIQSQIRVLNTDFGRLNADTINTRLQFQPFASSAKIEFFLATKDPMGNSTTGIVRTNTSRTTFISDPGSNYLDQADEIKLSMTGGDDAWDPDHYLNIWTGDISYQGNIFLLGYAYPPANLPNWPNGQAAPAKAYEGVVLYYGIVGLNNPANTVTTNKRARTAVHEVGHYLGLRHIWGDITNCSQTTDYIDDTPKASTPSNTGNCNKAKNSCNEGSGDMPDMIENYMDYSPETCQNMFTKQQVLLMRNIIRTERPQLPELIIDGKPAGTVEEPLQYTLLPNPTSEDFIMIQYNNTLQEDIVADVFDMLGRRVYTYTLEAGKFSYKLDLDPVNSGVYYLLVRGEKNRKGTRFVKVIQ